MNLFIAVKHSQDARYFYGGLWSGNFYPALRQLGCEIIESKVDLLPASRFMHVAEGFTHEEKATQAEITQKIVKEVREAHQKKPVDLFLSYFYNAHFDPAGFDEIHRLGIPTVNFYCNSIHQFAWVSEIAKKVKFSWHTEKAAASLYSGVGANPIWVQMAADPAIYHPVPDGRRETRACFVGQRYADRDRLAARLVEQNVPLDLFGPGWGADVSKNGCSSKDQPKQNIYLGRKMVRPGSFGSYVREAGKNICSHGILGGAQRTLRQLQYRRENQKYTQILNSVKRHPGIDFKEISRTFSGYEVVLNFSHVWSDGRPGSKLIPHVRLRDFEAPMCRTCYLTGYSEELGEFYEFGKEVDCYHTPEELVDKTQFYLTHPDEAERLREAGYRRALRDHQWANRFQELFQKIGIANSKL